MSFIVFDLVILFEVFVIILGVGLLIGLECECCFNFLVGLCIFVLVVMFGCFFVLFGEKIGGFWIFVVGLFVILVVMVVFNFLV